MSDYFNYSILDDITDSIKESCNNLNDVEGYCENCLLYDPQAGADYYGVKKNRYL